MKNNGTVYDRVIRGGRWFVLFRAANQALVVIRLIVLARLLSPNDFGLVGVALLSIGIIDALTNSGFVAALIQKNERYEEYLNSAWTVQIIRGAVLSLVLLLVAPFIASLFEAPSTESIIQVLAFSQLLKGFQNIGVVQFRKELDFRRHFQFVILSTLADTLVSIMLAFILKNAWALVIGVLAGHFVALISSYILHPYRPVLEFNLKKIHDLFTFGKWMLGSSVILFFISFGANLFIGKIIGIAALGLYQMAQKISDIHVTEISRMLSNIAFPAYSKLQNDISKMKNALTRSYYLFSFLGFPLAGLIWVLAPEFTNIFLGDKWIEMVPALRILGLVSAVHLMIAIPKPFYLSIGAPNIPVKRSLFQLTVIAMLLYPLTVRYGIEGAAISVLAGGSCALLFDMVCLKNMKGIHMNYSQLIKESSPFWGGTILFCLCIIHVKGFFSTAFVPFTLFIFTAIVIYTTVNYLYYRIIQVHPAFDAIHKAFKDMF